MQLKVNVYDYFQWSIVTITSVLRYITNRQFDRSMYIDSLVQKHYKHQYNHFLGQSIFSTYC